MRAIATIRFKNAETKGEGVIVIRASNQGVALALSLEDDGDVETVLSEADVTELIHGLQNALAILS
jgi:hypothetical protein